MGLAVIFTVLKKQIFLNLPQKLTYNPCTSYSERQPRPSWRLLLFVWRVHTSKSIPPDEHPLGASGGYFRYGADLLWKSLRL